MPRMGLNLSSSCLSLQSTGHDIALCHSTWLLLALYKHVKASLQTVEWAMVTLYALVLYFSPHQHMYPAPHLFPINFTVYFFPLPTKHYPVVLSCPPKCPQCTPPPRSHLPLQALGVTLYPLLYSLTLCCWLQFFSPVQSSCCDALPSSQYWALSGWKTVLNTHSLIFARRPSSKNIKQGNHTVHSCTQCLADANTRHEKLQVHRDGDVPSKHRTPASAGDHSQNHGG